MFRAEESEDCVELSPRWEGRPCDGDCVHYIMYIETTVLVAFEIAHFVLFVIFLILGSLLEGEGSSLFVGLSVFAYPQSLS